MKYLVSYQFKGASVGGFGDTTMTVAGGDERLSAAHIRNVRASVAENLIADTDQVCVVVILNVVALPGGAP